MVPEASNVLPMKVVYKIKTTVEGGYSKHKCRYTVAGNREQAEFEVRADIAQHSSFMLLISLSSMFGSMFLFLCQEWRSYRAAQYARRYHSGMLWEFFQIMVGFSATFQDYGEWDNCKCWNNIGNSNWFYTWRIDHFNAKQDCFAFGQVWNARL